MPVEVDTKLAFIMKGSTKQEGDCEAALERLKNIAHDRRIVVERDEETYRVMVNLKLNFPCKYKWLLPIPGGRHILLHASKALLQRYYAAGIESICKECGADDKHVLLGSNYRRNHHWLMVTFEALWRCVIERYVAAHPGVDLGNVDVRAEVIPWLERKAQDHKTLRFWVNFLLDDMPPLHRHSCWGTVGKPKIASGGHTRVCAIFHRYGQGSIPVGDGSLPHRPRSDARG